MIRRLVFGCILLATCLVCRTAPAAAAATPGLHALQLLAQRYGVTPGEIAGFLATLPAPQIALLQQDLAEIQALTPAQIRLLLDGAAGAQGQAGGSGQTVARWIQMAPGSSVDAILAGSWGDQPTSIFPTILARAVISGGACPVVRLDRGLVVPMRVRFTGAQLTSLPDTAGSPPTARPATRPTSCRTPRRRPSPAACRWPPPAGPSARPCCRTASRSPPWTAST